MLQSADAAAAGLTLAARQTEVGTAEGVLDAANAVVAGAGYQVRPLSRTKHLRIMISFSDTYGLYADEMGRLHRLLSMAINLPLMTRGRPLTGPWLPPMAHWKPPKWHKPS